MSIRTLVLSATLMSVALGLGGGLPLGSLDAEDTGNDSVSSVTWPQTLTTANWQLRLYHPHVESLHGDQLSARAAFSITPAGQTQESFGVVWLKAHAMTDRDTRTITLSDQSVSKIHLPGGSDQEQNQVTKDLGLVIKELNPVLSMDRVLASLADVERDRKASQSLAATVPKIIVTDHPTLLVYIDGDPKLAAMADTRFERILNTPYQLVRDTGTSALWLHYGERWYSAATLPGPWKVVAPVPDAVSALAPALQGFAVQTGATPIGDVLDIITSQQPAELVYTTGQPALEPIDGTNLLAITNSPNELFMDTPTQQYYLLLDGRWFHTGDFRKGSWQVVSAGALPPDFSHIPADSKYGTVLASVPGTTAAEEAALDAQVTQTAQIKRSATIEVPYDGAPQFQPIAGTQMSYAVNTQNDVILGSDHTCYCCYQGVWYQSSTPDGPWSVAISLPAELDTIPPDNPLYYDTFCHVYDATPDYVYVGYTPGYNGCYLANGCVVWGTGFTYNCWWGNHYYARPLTWGFGMSYNPWTAHWGMGIHSDIGGSNGWFAFGIAQSNGGWWGPSGYRPVLPVGAGRDNPGRWIDTDHIRPELRDRISQAQSSNLYRRGENGQRVIASHAAPTTHAGEHVGDHPAEHPVAGNGTGAVDRPIAGNSTVDHPGAGKDSIDHPERPVRGPVEPEHPLTTAPRLVGRPEDPVMPGKDGEIYRKDASGWQQWQRQGWQNVQTEARPTPVVQPRSTEADAPRQPTAPPQHEEARTPEPSRIDNLERQRESEERGVERSRSFEQYRSSPPSSMHESRGGGGSTGGSTRH